MKNTRAVLAACAALTVACGGGSAPPAHLPGATEFVSRAPGAGGARGDAAGGAGGAGLPTATPAPTTPDSAAAARAVAEGDLYATAGSTLFVLNGYRGLLALDVADPARPRLAARVPLTGRPVDLYVRDGLALFTVSDWWGWAIAADGAATPEQGSRLWAVDVSDPAAPRVLATLPLEGSLLTSRVVGGVLYAVSRTTSWWGLPPCGGLICPAGGGAAPPAGGGGVATGGGSVAADGVVAPPPDRLVVTSFDVSSPAAIREVDREEVTLAAGLWDAHAHVTAERLVVALGGWGASAPEATFVAFDLSDPGGAIVRGAEWTAPGSVRDRWGMDLAGGVFRAVLDDGFNRGATLRTWRAATAAAQPEPLGTLALDVPESLTAARFDGARAYVVTAVRRDPLWVVDLADDARPALLGHLEMPGQLDFVEPRGDRLVALGHTDEAAGPWQLHVSLFDVAGATPVMLSRVFLGQEYGWTPAQSDDVRKVFQVLDGSGLVLVPFESHDRETWTSTGGTQLIDLSRDALVLRGFLAHAGGILRALPLPGRPATLAAFSEEKLQLVDATDRGAPRELASLDLARPVWDLALAGEHVVELSGEAWRGGGELVVAPRSDPDASAPTARVALARHGGGQLFQRGPIAWVAGQDWRDGRFTVEAHDLSDPAAPRRRGTLERQAQGSSFGPAALSPAAPVLAALRWSWAAGEPGLAVLLVDLGDPDAPRVAAEIALPGASGWDLRWSGSTLWLTRYEWGAGIRDGYVRFWLERIDAASPAAPRRLPPVNVPGTLLAASDDGRRVYTLETAWEEPGAGRTVLHALDVDEAKATLRGSVAVDGWPAGALVHGGFAYAVASAWDGAGDRTRLVAIDLASLRVTSELPVARGWVWPLGAAGSKLLLSSSWPSQGVLVLDLADPARPALARFEPLQGWAWKVVSDGVRAWLPAGPYGVALVPLS
jgi:hypothetical protein